MKKNINVILLFILLTLILTYPLISKINGYIPGFFSTDEPYVALWDSWRIKYSFTQGLPFGYTNFIAYPFGINLYSTGYFSYLWMALYYFLSIITTPAITYNLQVLINFFLCGIFTFLLVLYLTKSRTSAIFSGIIFAFCPYQFMRAWQHLGLTYNQWFPLSLLAVILLKERPCRRHRILFFISMLLLFSFDFSVMYIAAIALLGLIVYILSYNLRMKFFKQNRFLLVADFKFLKRIIIIGCAVFVILLPQLYPILKNMAKFSAKSAPAANNAFHRPFEDLFSQSARPLSYFLPAPVHPIFGKFTEQFIGSSLYGESLTEHALYLGWVPLILAFVAIRRWRKRRKVGTVPFGDNPYHKEDFYIGFFIFLGVLAWLFSQPPWWKIGPLKIYMPSFFMYKILPMYRAYCRFGIMVMLAVAVLAGFGLSFILEKFKSQKIKTIVFCLFATFVLFEFWNWPPYKVIDVSKVPAVYYWLKEQPGDFAIAEYPIDTNGANVMYMFYQTKHEKKIINGTIPGTPANKIVQTIIKLSDPRTAGVLKWMGVRYVLVHREEYLKTELTEEIEELDKIPKILGLKFIKDFPAQECPQKDIKCTQETGPVDVYEVIAPSIEPVVKD